MAKEISQWARTISSIGAGILGLYFIVKPTNEFLRQDPSEDSPPVKEYIRAERDAKRIEKALEKAQANRFWLEDLSTTNIASSYERIGDIQDPMIAALQKLQEAHTEYLIPLNRNENVRAWRHKNRNKEIDLAGSLGLGALILFASYNLYPKKK